MANTKKDWLAPAVTGFMGIAMSAWDTLHCQNLAARPDQLSLKGVA